MRGTLLPPSSFDLDLGMSLPSYSDSAKVAYVLQAALMSAIYEENKDEDGFLYMTYSGENTFGLLYMALAATAIALNASCVVLATGFGALISKVAEHWYELYKMDKQGGNLWFIYWWEDKVSAWAQVLPPRPALQGGRMELRRHHQDVRGGGEGDGVPGQAFQPANLGLRKEDKEQLLSGLVVETSGQGEGFQMLKEHDNRNFCDVLSSILFSFL
ncbi:uncharacterized protein [Aegilops tauschii subsp. strangulata]|uniref:uncharacterized protein isoform X1 n=1 Tax=Aegilops tauschii subsp. strangulata TaxID=200361 RepID=UPI001ABC2803|nr:uncharacterized protein LOC109780358 isoform X1 [Aegilops tauschii subsp. strangulata]